MANTNLTSQNNTGWIYVELCLIRLSKWSKWRKTNRNIAFILLIKLSQLSTQNSFSKKRFSSTKILSTVSGTSRALKGSQEQIQCIKPL